MLAPLWTRTAARLNAGAILPSALHSSPLPGLMQTRNATKRGGGSSKNGRDSTGKRLGTKKYGGEFVLAGNIIIRQRGTHHHAGQHVGKGRDHTLYALAPGYVQFYRDTVGGKEKRMVGITLTPEERLPRDEDAVGRSRYWGQVDTRAWREQAKEYLDGSVPEPIVAAEPVATTSTA